MATDAPAAESDGSTFIRLAQGQEAEILPPDAAAPPRLPDSPAQESPPLPAQPAPTAAQIDRQIEYRLSELKGLTEQWSEMRDLIAQASGRIHDLQSQILTLEDELTERRRELAGLPPARGGGEAAGNAEQQDQIETLEAELAELNELLKAAETKLARTESESVVQLKELQAQNAELAARFSEQQKESEAAAAREAELQKTSKALQARIERQKREVAALEDQQQSLKSEIEAAGTRRAQLETETAAASDLAKIDEEIAQRRKLVESLQIKLTEREERFASLDSDLATGSQTLAAIRDAASAAEAKRDALLGEIKAAGKTLEETQARLQETEKELAERSKARDAARAEMEKLRASAEKARQDAESAKARAKQAETELSELESATAASLSRRQSIEERFRQREEEIAKLQEEEATARAALDEANSERLFLHREQKAAQQETAALQEQMEDLRDTIEQEQQRRAALNKEQEALRTEVALLARTRLAIKEEILELGAARQALVAPAPPPVEEPAAPDPTAATPSQEDPPEAEPAAPQETGRAPELVAEALRRAPGLPGPGSSERARLSELLISGACVTDAMIQALGSINRQTLAALVRSLGGC